MRHRNPNIAIVVVGLVTLGVVFLLATQHLHSGAASAPEAGLQEPDPVAVVKSILVNGAEQVEVAESDMRVTRLTAEVLGGQTGMLLAAGDEIGTGPNAKVTLLFLDAAPERDNEVLIDSNARMRVGSIVNLLGRVLVRSKGRFGAATQRVKLDEAGTEYELLVQPDGTNRIRILDGALRVQKGSNQTTPTLRRQVIPRPQVSPQVNQTSTLAQELQQVTLGPDGTLRPNNASPSEIDETLNWSNEVIVASQPSYSAQSIIPHLQSWQERAEQFRMARRGAILNNDPDSYEAVGRTYVDWGNGAKAVDELRKAVSASQTPERMTSLGEAFRLTGNLRLAQSVLGRAVRQYPDYAPGLNALGNVYFDRAKVAQDMKDYEGARRDLQIARRHYDRARISSSSSIISESNIAETELALGDIDREQDRREEALDHYKQAERTFNRVEQASRSYVFATKGLGDAYRGMSGIARIRQDSSLATAHFARAQEKYSQALKAHRDATEAYVGLGRLYEDHGRKDEAIKMYWSAIRVRPEVPQGYYYYSVAIADRDPGRAAIYAKAYLRLEREVLKQGEKARNARDVVAHRPPITTPETTTPTDPSSTTEVPGVVGNKQDDALRKLREKGLGGQPIRQPDCKADGKVVATDPKKDTRVPRGTIVTLFVSSLGENNVAVPAVTNQSLGEAQRELQSLGLVVDAGRKRETNAVPENTVIEQDPKAPSRLNRGCTVKLTVSIRVRLIEVPRYIGLSRQEALRRLPRLSLGGVIRGRVSEGDSQFPPGTVFDQNPKPGAMVEPGTSVDLIISRSKSGDDVGQNYATVPNLYGMTLAQAKAALANANLKLGNTSNKVASGNEPVNRVVSQYPKASQKVPKGTAVNVVVSYTID